MNGIQPGVTTYDLRWGVLYQNGHTNVGRSFDAHVADRPIGFNARDWYRRRQSDSTEPSITNMNIPAILFVIALCVLGLEATDTKERRPPASMRGANGNPKVR